MSITVKSAENGYRVFFPFELKDNFRKTFPSAKWIAADRCWAVGPRSKKRLDQWVELARPAAVEIQAEIDEQQSAGLTHNELVEIETELLQIRAEIANRRAQIRSFARSHQTLDTARADLASAQESLAIARKEAADEAKRTKSIVETIIDLDEVCAALLTMQRETGAFGQEAKGRFSQAKQIVREQHERLKDAGFYCHALQILSEMSINRPKRDKPSDIMLSDFYKISEIKK